MFELSTRDRRSAPPRSGARCAAAEARGEHQRTAQAFIPRSPLRAPRARNAFTLIELMVVCGIIALVMAISVPSIYRQLHPESMQGAVRELIEICNTARAQAILGGTPSELVINTANRTVSVGVAAREPGTVHGIEFEDGPKNTLESKSVSGGDWRMSDRKAQGVKSTSRSASPTSGGAEGALTSITLPEGIQIEGIRLNFLDYTDDETVRVRFHPNGTSDEFSLFLLSDKGERRQVFLEVVTGLADFESDPQKFR